MDNMRGLFLLSHGRLNGNSQNQKNQKGETEHAGKETIHGQISWVRYPSIESSDVCNL